MAYVDGFLASGLDHDACRGDHYAHCRRQRRHYHYSCFGLQRDHCYANWNIDDRC